MISFEEAADAWVKQTIRAMQAEGRVKELEAELAVLKKKPRKAPKEQPNG